MELAAGQKLWMPFGQVTDPRVERTKEHVLLDIIVIAVCGVICGADNWVEIELWGQENERWLRQFLALPNGIASHDTFGRVFARLDETEFQNAFIQWVQSAYTISGGQVIAIDGKQLRRSHDRTLGKAAIHRVSAWATHNHLTLGQRKVDAKSNEITAIPQLLDVLMVEGGIVTIDAMGCQTDIAQKIIDKKADYVLALKENQANLYQDVVDLFDHAQQTSFRTVDSDYVRTVEKDHGRIELRECWTITDPNGFPYLHNASAWANLQTRVMVRRERRLPDKTTVETAYYISSRPKPAAPLLDATRSHWGVENSLHWVLDLAFREDESRMRHGNSPQNFAVLRHVALNLLKQDVTTKLGIKAKRLKAACNHTYLLKVLGI
jgi:predicted transposase YbfD/YdcC